MQRSPSQVDFQNSEFVAYACGTMGQGDDAIAKSEQGKQQAKDQIMRTGKVAGGGPALPGPGFSNFDKASTAAGGSTNIFGQSSAGLFGGASGQQSLFTVQAPSPFGTSMRFGAQSAQQQQQFSGFSSSSFGASAGTAMSYQQSTNLPSQPVFVPSAQYSALPASGMNAYAAQSQLPCSAAPQQFSAQRY